ncbi:hypothetical protein NC651_018243 [Populus alba x Populus x berolinensis]|nr:hypothetical protein NC651_018243 [Populus alba x Populus x berolinensis]
MSRRHRQNFIPAIQRMDGSLTSSSAEVRAAFVDFYCHLLATPKVTAPIEVDVIQQGPCIDVASHACLLAPASDLDIKNALFDIDDGKAPGPDGYSSCFFKKSWVVIHEDFCLAVRDFFQSGAMLKQINHSIITLIPKSANTSFASDFRPISCCNVIYKVIAKLLAARLSQALVPIISPMQNAFLGGRLMTDNIPLLQELLRNYERKRTSPRCLMKIDFKKAFDSIQWPFLLQLLLLLGFPSRFVQLIMQCVETASYSVAVNGSIYGFFPGKNGVRIPLPFSAFADDVILLSRGDRPSVSCLFHIRHSILEDTGFAKGSFPFRYLGVPLSPHHLLASQFSPLLHKLESAIHGWLRKNLSYTGRAELLKFVLYGMSKSALVNWHTVCLPKSEGGLGFFDIKARNNSFLAKLIWNNHLKSDSIWIKWVHHYYLQSSSIWDITAHPSSSPLWKSTILFRNNLYDLCGGHPQSLSLMALWNTSEGAFSSNAYDYLRFRSSQVHWRRVIWEPWSLPRFSFILWLAILGRLRTRDRLHSLQTDSTCIFYHVDDESHSHLFFGCQWTSLLWNRVKHWLHITRNMSTLDRAVRGLCKSGSGAEESFRPGSTRSYISMRMTTSLFNLGDDRVSLFWMVWTCGQLSNGVVSPLVSDRFLICFSGLCMALHAFSRDLMLCAALIGCTISFFLLVAVCGPSLDSVESPFPGQRGGLPLLPPSYRLGSILLVRSAGLEGLMFRLVSPLIKGVFLLLGRPSQLIGACLLALFACSRESVPIDFWLSKGVCSFGFLFFKLGMRMGSSRESVPIAFCSQHPCLAFVFVKVYKCIAKILAGRMKVVLPSLVGPYKTAFISRQRISDNILLSQGLMKGYHKSTGLACCALKVDLMKAYDSVRWDFVDATLIKMGFPRTVVDCIMVCVTSCQFSINVNGELAGYFQGGRGLRQGDPLSPYLFVLCMEILSGLFCSMSANQNFKFHWRCKKDRISHPCFADDLMIFSKGDVHSVRAEREQIISILGFREGELPMKYLGVPLISSRLKVVNCKGLVDRITAKVRHWTCRTLSFAGRVQLINSVLFSIQVCLPKKEGGLGIKRITEWNKIALLKHIWNLCNDSDGSIWSTWIRSNLLRGRNFWTIKAPESCSWAWGKILKLRSLAWPKMKHIIGDGMTTSLWFDNWHPHSPLANT